MSFERSAEEKAHIAAFKKPTKGKSTTRDLKPTDDEKARTRSTKRVSFRIGGVEVLKPGEGYAEWLRLVQVADPPSWGEYAISGAIGDTDKAVGALRRKAGLDAPVDNPPDIDEVF